MALVHSMNDYSFQLQPNNLMKGMQYIKYTQDGDKEIKKLYHFKLYKILTYILTKHNQ